MPVRIDHGLECLEHAGLVVVKKESYDGLLRTIERQTEEIDILDKRIKRLLER